MVQADAPEFRAQGRAGHPQSFRRADLVAVKVTQHLAQDHAVEFVEDAAIEIGAVVVKQSTDILGYPREGFLGAVGRAGHGGPPAPVGQAIGRDDIADGVDDCVFDGTLQLPDVSWPRVALDQSHRFRGQRCRRLIDFLVGQFQKMFDQQREVFVAFP